MTLIQVAPWRKEEEEAKLENERTEEHAEFDDFSGQARPPPSPALTSPGGRDRLRARGLAARRDLDRRGAACGIVFRLTRASATLRYTTFEYLERVVYSYTQEYSTE